VQKYQVKAIECMVGVSLHSIECRCLVIMFISRNIQMPNLYTSSSGLLHCVENISLDLETHGTCVPLMSAMHNTPSP